MTMPFLTRTLSLLAMTLLLFSRTAWCCPEGKAWNDHSAISFSTGPASSLSFVRFADGLYVQLEDEKSVKEMYSLEKFDLFKGYDPAQATGVSPFFMMDMPVGIVLSLLAGYFPQPCAIPAAPTSFEYSGNLGRKKITVRGNAHLATPTSIVFDLFDLERQQAGGDFKTSGTIEFLDISPIPADMDISGWTASRGPAPYAEIIARPEDVTTLEALRKMLQDKQRK